MIKNNNKNKSLDLRGIGTHLHKIEDTHRTLEKMEIALGSRMKNRVIAQDAKMQKNKDISNGLKEIYQDDANNMNIGNIVKDKRSGLMFWFFNILLFLFLVVAVGGAGFYYMNYSEDSAKDVLFTVENNKSVMINEDFFYTIKYENPTNIILSDVVINVEYPDNFIFADSVPKKDKDIANKSVWNIGKILPNSSGEIKIKGKIINKNKSNILFAEMIYNPSNFSGNLKKEISSHIILKDNNWQWDADIPAIILVGETKKMQFGFNLDNGEYLHNFIIDINKPKGMRIMNIKAINNSQGGSIRKLNIDSGVDKNQVESWEVSNLSSKNKFEIEFKFDSKPGDNKDIEFNFKKEENGTEYVFFKKSEELEVVKSDLDLTLVINGTSEDKPVNFGERLNYSVNYTNKGETPLENVSIMVVLDSNFLDWTTLKDENFGTEKGNTLVWGKNEISKLGMLEVNETGVINFSIDVAPFVADNNISDKEFLIKSYARFNIRADISSSTVVDDVDNVTDNDHQSNTIINKINSDLTLSEEIRYFDKNNIPVGVGPLPPKVDTKTSFKVYWTLKNNLHELDNIKVKTELPNYVKWNKKQRTSVGDISYNSEDNTVTWNVGRLPLAVYRADAEFSINITPTREDLNRILVLLNGSKISAIDTETKDKLSSNTMPKTSKLEDDEIAQISSDGRVIK